MALPIVGSDQQNIIKFNAKSSKWRVDDLLLNEVTMIVDMDNLQIGWLRFAEGQPPGFELIEARAHATGTPFPAMPPDVDSQGKPVWRRGFRVTCKLADQVASGRPSIREWSGNSMAVNAAVDRLHDAWLAARARHPNHLPVVRSASSEVVPSRNGDTFVPILTIERWAPRPSDLGANGAVIAVGSSNFDDLEPDDPIDDIGR